MVVESFLKSAARTAVDGCHVTTNLEYEDEDHLRNMKRALQTSERAFLEGNFRRSLQVANRCLCEENIARDSLQNFPKSSWGEKDSSPPICLPVNAILSFAFEGTSSVSINKDPPRTFHVRLDSMVCLVDQISAIALQSWFEIERSQRERHKLTRTTKNEDGRYRHLLPFLNIYISDSSSRQSRPIPLELMVMFLQFCEAESHIQDAIQISVNLLANRFLQEEELNENGGRGTLQNKTDLDQNYHELLVLLVTRLLPLLNDPDMARHILLERIFNPQSFAGEFELTSGRVIGTQANLDTLSVISTSLSEVSVSFTDEIWWVTVIDEAKSQLDFILLQSEVENDGLVRKSSLGATASSDWGISSTERRLENLTLVPHQQQGWWIRTMIKVQNRWMQLVKHTIKRLHGDTSTSEDETNTNSGQQDRAWARKIAFSIALVLLAWRKNRTFRRATKSLIMLILAPANELLEALASTPST